MSETVTSTAESNREATALWKAGVVAGILGAAVMAALISLMNAPTLAVAIPALYTLRRRRTGSPTGSSTALTARCSA